MKRALRGIPVWLTAIVAGIAAYGSEPPTLDSDKPAAHKTIVSVGPAHGSRAQPSRTERRLVVVAPHLDDAALSLGATIARAARSGTKVTVLTVFAGDPESREPAGVWDSLCGFTTAGEAAAARREEDMRACELLGAEPVWLPFADGDYAADRDAQSVWEAVAPPLAGAALALVPGYPLAHLDHAWLTQLVAQRAETAVGLYVEQPYANLVAIPRGHTSRAALRAASSIALRTPSGRAILRPAPHENLTAWLGSAVEWRRASASRRDRRAKLRAIGAYESQVPWLGRRLVPRIRLYEWGWGGEGLGVPARPDSSTRTVAALLGAARR